MADAEAPVRGDFPLYRGHGLELLQLPLNNRAEVCLHIPGEFAEVGFIECSSADGRGIRAHVAVWE